MADLDFKNLTNEELLVIYNKINEHLIVFNENLDDNIIVKNIKTSDGPSLKFIEVSNTDKEKILDSEYYKSICSILDKLKPVVGLIEETTPELLTKLNLKKNE